MSDPRARDLSVSCKCGHGIGWHPSGLSCGVNKCRCRKYMEVKTKEICKNCKALIGALEALIEANLNPEPDGEIDVRLYYRAKSAIAAARQSKEQAA